MVSGLIRTYPEFTLRLRFGGASYCRQFLTTTRAPCRSVIIALGHRRHAALSVATARRRARQYCRRLRPRHRREHAPPRGRASCPPARCAVRWLREQARARKLREEETRRYVWWTLSAPVLSVIVGVVGLMVTWFGR